jgi:hypothetical protein
MRAGYVVVPKTLVMCTTLTTFMKIKSQLTTTGTDAIRCFCHVKSKHLNYDTQILQLDNFTSLHLLQATCPTTHHRTDTSATECHSRVVLACYCVPIAQTSTIQW